MNMNSSGKRFGPLLMWAALMVPAFASAGLKIENGRLTQEKPVLFVADTAELTPEADEALEQVRSFMAANTYVSLWRIESHMAAGGVESLSQAVTEARATQVALWLAAKGIDCYRLLPVGFGVTKPVVSPDGPDRAQNTRIEFVPAALRGKLIGGAVADGGGVSPGLVCP